MSKITFNDIVALAKAGYSPATVKELLTIETEPESKKEPEVKTEPEAKTDDIDYKKLYEEEKAKNERIQTDNTMKDIQPEKIDFSELVSGIKDALY